MSIGQLRKSDTVGFTQDRFNNPNGAIYMNPGYYILPPGIYFNNSFTFLVWVKILSFGSYARIIDCGNGPYSNNVVVSYSFGGSKVPYTQIFVQGDTTGTIEIYSDVSANTWFHLASVFDGHNLTMYLNGNFAATNLTTAPLGVERSQCYIGRSSWTGDPRSRACFDDLMIFNRALTSNEVQNFMNSYFTL
jgi:hypothetical protein